MMSPSRSLGGWARVGVLLGLAACAGCRPATDSGAELGSAGLLGRWRRPPREATSEAVALPLVDRDPAEQNAQADCWPGWRGWNSSGIAPAGSPAVRFSASEGFRWKMEVSGEGNSSPVVWDDHVLLSTALAGADPPTLALLDFDRADGRLRWQAEAGAARGRTHVKNGYASATPATDGQRVFAFFGSLGLFCYDLGGNRLWRAELGELSHQYGTASSPVLYGDLVIQLCDSERGSYLAAFDKRSGEPAWRTPRPSSGCWSTPVLVAAVTSGSRRSELVINGTGSEKAGAGLVIAYDPADGRELWRVQGTTELVAPTALSSGGLVYSVSGRNGPIFAIRPGGEGDVTESRVVWKVHRGGAYIPTGVVYRNRLYVLGDSGGLACYNAGNGQLLWGTRLRGAFTSSLVAAAGRLYATSERGTVYVFAAADSFELLAQNELGERCLATPAIAGGDLFIRTEKHLYCFQGLAPSQ